MSITVELSEEHYWILAQAVSAAGTASHRHGMERHAERFHEAEKNLFRAYEQQNGTDEMEFRVKTLYRDSLMEVATTDSGNLTECVESVISTNPEYRVVVEQKV